MDLAVAGNNEYASAPLCYPANQHHRLRESNGISAGNGVDRVSGLGNGGNVGG